MSNTGVDIDGDGIPDRDYDYDYHLFRYSDLDDQVGSGHLLKLVHPRYYYHYGYFETPSEIEDGFYETSDLMEDVMIFTVDGKIREGEEVTSFEEVWTISQKQNCDMRTAALIKAIKRVAAAKLTRGLFP